MVLEGSPTTAESQVYARASALLDYLPGDLYVWDNGTSSQWRSAHCKNMGAALGAKYQVGNEWRRDFAGGTVRVDPTLGTSYIPPA
jgi:hypothetical protein